MEIHGMKVLSVDDNLNNLLMIEAFAKKLNLRVDSYNLPVQGLMAAEKKEYDLVIVDYMMPVMNGIEFIKAYRQIDMVTPIVMITAVGDDSDVQLSALNSGATDFLSKPVNYPAFTGRARNLLKLKKAHIMLQEKALNLEADVKKATSEILEREIETLRVLGKTAEYKDPETGSHIIRVANYAKVVANDYGLSRELQDVLFKASPFHDIGKVGIQDSILLKPGKLDEDEWQVMQKHALIGYEILKRSQSEYLKAGGIIAFSHHEKYDGSGYPKGLKGSSIPILGRIVAIADVFDALTTKRPYKEAWTFEEGVTYILDQSGKHFDPELVAAFNHCIDQIRDIYDTYSEDQ